VSGSSAEPTTDRPSYIRGAGGVEGDTRQVIRVVVAVCIAVLVAWAAVLAVSTARQSSRESNLQRNGVTVGLTVTGCTGLASGSGDTVFQYTCRGTYTLDGHQFNDVLEGTISEYPVGQQLQGVTLRSDPSLLYIAQAIHNRSFALGAYLTPIILGAVAVALALGVILAWRRSRASERSGAG
jgi:hypothetical protein